MSRLTTVELFCKAAESRSFTAAAETTGTTPSAVSKAVSRLERRLAVKLFERTTRAVRLTDEGQAYYKCCSQALADIDDIEAELAVGRVEPRGKLRISLPASYGLKRVVPYLGRYLERYPKVSVDVNLSNEVKDFIADGFDMAVRLGRVQDSRLIAVPLHKTRYCIVASSAYLQRHGRPTKPEDLLDHSCIDLVLSGTGRPLPWMFGDSDSPRALQLPCRLVFDDPMAALGAAVSGAGLVRLLDYTVNDDIRAGRLVEVLAATGPTQTVSAVYPYTRHPVPKTRSFIAFLTELQKESERPSAARD